MKEYNLGFILEVKVDADATADATNGWLNKIIRHLEDQNLPLSAKIARYFAEILEWRIRSELRERNSTS